MNIRPQLHELVLKHLETEEGRAKVRSAFQCHVKCLMQDSDTRTIRALAQRLSCKINVAAFMEAYDALANDPKNRHALPRLLFPTLRCP